MDTWQDLNPLSTNPKKSHKKVKHTQTIRQTI